MGKKTVRGWVRVICEYCNGTGKVENTKVLQNGEIVSSYIECEDCWGCGKVNRTLGGRLQDISNSEIRRDY